MAHDIGDFVMNGGKVVRDLQLLDGIIVDMMYLSIVLSWLYPRVIFAWMGYLPIGFVTFGGCAWVPDGLCKYVDWNRLWGVGIQTVSLAVLSFMNLYWCILIIGVGCQKKDRGGYVAEFQGELASQNDKQKVK